MSRTKTALPNSKLANFALGILVVANGFLLVGFAKGRKDGVKNYIRRSFVKVPASYISTDKNDIIADVHKYMSKQQQEDSSKQEVSGVISETIFQIAQTYRSKGDHAADLKTKAGNYLLALLELEKLPTKNPKIVKQAKPAKEQIKTLLRSFSTVGVMPGDSREKIEILYGLADKTKLSDRYYPIGSVTYLTYDKIGLQFGLRNNRIFAINIRSNFKGIVNGVRIGNDLNSIKALYKGKTSDFPGSNYAYQGNLTKHRKFTFVFNDQDDLVDGIKLFDKKLYGSWVTTLR
jgi:hypothetical protein